MIETFACVSHGARHFVIGQIDLYWLVVAVEKSVEVFCSHDDVVDDCCDNDCVVDDDAYL